MIKISIIIPLYNKEINCIHAINSVLSQTYENFELIIVNDGSTDSSLSVAQKTIANDSRARVIDQKNGGVSLARNRGVLESNFNYLAFLDADDLWQEKYLEYMVSAIKANPQNKWFGAGSQDFIGELHVPIIKDSYLNWQTDDYFKASVLHPTSETIINSNSFIVEKSLFLTAGQYSENTKHNEDYILYHNLAQHSKITWTVTVLTYYRHDSENQATKSLPILPPTSYQDERAQALSKNEYQNLWLKEFDKMVLLNWISSILKSGLNIDANYPIYRFFRLSLCTKYSKKKLVRIIPAIMMFKLSPTFSKTIMKYSSRRINL